MLRALLAGLGSMVLTAAVVAWIDVFFEWNVLHYHAVYFVPVGAAIAGMVAGGGFVGAAILLHVRATPLAKGVLLLTALLTYPMVYFLEYEMLRDLGRLPGAMTIGTFVAQKVTGAPLSVSVVGQPVVLGTVDWLGWITVALDLFAFAVGGLLAFEQLSRWPWCDACARYGRQSAKKVDYFAQVPQFEQHWQELAALDHADARFAELAASQPTGTPLIDQEDSVKLTTKVFTCRSCDQQHLRQQVELYRGKEWQDVESLSRQVALAPGIDVAQHYRRAPKPV